MSVPLTQATQFATQQPSNDLSILSSKLALVRASQDHKQIFAKDCVHCAWSSQ